MDVLTIARERQGALRAEIAEIEEFIRMADRLLGSVNTTAGSPPGRAEWAGNAEQAGPARQAESDLQDEPAAQAEPAESGESTDDPAEADSAEDAKAAEVGESPAAESAPEPAPANEPLVRRFPWTNVQPPLHAGGTDDTAGPTRRNLMRRHAS